jgi:hypothetical protein
MSFACPNCSKDIPDVVSKTTFDERVSKLSEGKRAAEERATKAEGLARQAAPLAAKAHGYEFDGDSLEMLQARYEKSQKAGYESDFASWLGDSEGAGKDPVASRFRSSAPAAPPARTPEAPQATPPVTPPAPRLPTTPTTTTTPPVVRMTAEQVAAQNAKLLKEYKSASPERKAAIKAEIDQNRNQVGEGG